MPLVRRAAAPVAALAALAALVGSASADDKRCVHVDYKPAARPDLSPGKNQPAQMVVWLEDMNGVFVDTIYITSETGTYGLGNRPGRVDFNSGPFWPYGRRTTTFPVWAHRKHLFGSGDLLEFPLVAFQNTDDDNLSHPFNQSSRDLHYCRPMMTSESSWDALTCASPNGVFTDKGVMAGGSSLYPPRQDAKRLVGNDSESVDMYAMLNPFDAVSQATPPNGVPAQFSWPIPMSLPAGNYTMWLEVAKEFDHNFTYTTDVRPGPAMIPWKEYGDPYRGQPSVLFKVAFSVGEQASTGTTMDYVGYGDPDGLDGNIRTPDSTISTNITGSGAQRLDVITDGGTSFRVRVVASPQTASVIPDAVSHLEASTESSRAANIKFLSPQEDAEHGKVKGYDVRFAAGLDSITDATFDTATDPHLFIEIGDPGTTHTFALDRLLPDTDYTVAIRPFDDCRNTGPIRYLAFRTPERTMGEVDACFVATAAYGSVLAGDVEMLRHFRDAILRRTVLGELAVEAYYTFGPPVAGMIGESELLRWTARTVLDPFVAWARALHF
ncbi:MAG: fibronectin type III domain-containing protein [Polyangiales bacterium]